LDGHCILPLELSDHSGSGTLALPLRYAPPLEFLITLNCAARLWQRRGASPMGFSHRAARYHAAWQ
jgi:hypothetical protein